MIRRFEGFDIYFVFRFICFTVDVLLGYCAASASDSAGIVNIFHLLQ